ncbi:hypothetical protein CLL_A2537 [Clostridium botulinum B str. Eklund 17B (NRP)]|uniref:Uncharacterized protein n=1 Tax=Clostridium botulinum (strain Eklund 17B / Type B) TaxID=935198 RepID=B2TNB9_CLOBB|nr:hypothetical protein CLL_A2537 [Clostridium botulinum B str. Eklund 17B (NRP)]
MCFIINFLLNYFTTKFNTLYIKIFSYFNIVHIKNAYYILLLKIFKIHNSYG